MRQQADIILKKASVNEKATLCHRKIKLQSDQNTTFDTKISAFVPVADIRKAMPKIAVTVSIGNDNVRVVADSAADIANFFADCVVFIENYEKTLNSALQKQQQVYAELVVEKYNKKQEAKVVDFNQKIA